MQIMPTLMQALPSNFMSITLYVTGKNSMTLCVTASMTLYIIAKFCMTLYVTSSISLKIGCMTQKCMTQKYRPNVVGELCSTCKHLKKGDILKL